MLKRIMIGWLRWRYERLYKKYHQSFKENVLEAQAKRRLPAATVAARYRLNEVIDRLKVLDPDGNWKNFS